MPTYALIDGDVVAYRAACSAESNYLDTVFGEENLGTLEELAEQAAAWMISHWTEQAGCKISIVCLTGRGNFRKKVFPDYKSNRVNKELPKALDHVRKWIEANYKTHVIDGLEADDVLGILHTSDRMAGDSVIITIDKDLQSVAGWHFNPLKDYKPRKINKFAAEGFWMQQTLTGDSTDGYKGCPGIGPKKAEKLLAPFATMEQAWPTIVDTYNNAGLSINEAITTARLAKILTDDLYDNINQEVTLWHPTKPEKLPLKTILLVALSTTPKEASNHLTTSLPKDGRKISAEETSSSMSQERRTKVRKSKTSAKRSGT